MHDPTAIFRFEEHDIYLPMVVLEELDANKKGLSEASRNARQVSRFLDDMMRGVTKEQIDAGLAIPSGLSGNHGKKPSAGRLFFQTRELSGGLPEGLPGVGADNLILGQTLSLQRQEPRARVALVSKDINLRIKAAIVGVHAEDYYSDKTIEDADVLYTGVEALPADFWERHGKDMRSWKEGERTWYQVSGPAAAALAAEPVRLRGQPAGHRGDRARASTASRPSWSWRATFAASATASGASPRAIASRISRSIC